MSWAFLPFINRRLGIRLESITWIRIDSNPWGGRLVVDSRSGTARLGDVDEADAERLAALISRLSNRAKLRRTAQPPRPAVAPPAVA
jgi:hypothetical protein